MEISVIEAVGKVENGKQTFYFCSEACRQAFLKGGK
jgi:YHS domain-containing protein